MFVRHFMREKNILITAAFINYHLMLIFSSAAAAVAMVLAGSGANGLQLDFVTTFDVDKPAFITSWPAMRNSSFAHDFNLIVSSFGVGLFKSPDAIRRIDGVGEALRKKQFHAVQVADRIVWPNEVTVLDGDTVFSAGGFLVPGKKGHISSMPLQSFLSDDSASQRWTRIIENDDGFFHRVQRANVLGKQADGSVSSSNSRLISCRGLKGVFDNGGGEMVYFDPVLDERGNTVRYDVRTIYDGCDCFFEQIDLNGDGVMEFVIPQFFGSKLVLMWTEDPLGDYTKTHLIRTRVIDDSIGKVFDIQITDLLNNGGLDILVTNHESSKRAPLPALVAYRIELPSNKDFGAGHFETSAVAGQQQSEQHVMSKYLSASVYGKSVSDFMNKIQFKKSVLSQDFPVVGHGIQAAAPGSARAVKPTSSWNGAGVILVSGDDAEKAFVLEYNEATGDYVQRVFHDCGGTVGGIHARDVDSDGFVEVFVPCYTKNYVAVYRFST